LISDLSVDIEEGITFLPDSAVVREGMPDVVAVHCGTGLSGFCGLNCESEPAETDCLIPRFMPTRMPYQMWD
jgi:hypothetical protein